MRRICLVSSHHFFPSPHLSIEIFIFISRRLFYSGWLLHWMQRDLLVILSLPSMKHLNYPSIVGTKCPFQIISSSSKLGIVWMRIDSRTVSFIKSVLHLQRLVSVLLSVQDLPVCNRNKLQNSENKSKRIKQWRQILEDKPAHKLRMKYGS